MKSQSVIIMTHLENGVAKLPHIRQLAESNPDVEIHVLVGQESGRGKRHHWKNSDRELRRWWAENGSKVSGDVITIIEWDTLVMDQIPEMPPDADLAGAMVIIEDVTLRGDRVCRLMRDPRWSRQAWIWFAESYLLELGETPTVGLVSFGFMLCRRGKLDEICRAKWDYAFEKSIQNELRFPSIISASGGKVVEIDLPGVHHDETIPDSGRGIWHSVKHTSGVRTCHQAGKNVNHCKT